MLTFKEATIHTKSLDFRQFAPAQDWLSFGTTRFRRFYYRAYAILWDLIHVIDKQSNISVWAVLVPCSLWRNVQVITVPSSKLLISYFLRGSELLPKIYKGWDHSNGCIGILQQKKAGDIYLWQKRPQWPDEISSGSFSGNVHEVIGISGAHLDQEGASVRAEG